MFLFEQLWRHLTSAFSYRHPGTTWCIQLIRCYTIYMCCHLKTFSLFMQVPHVLSSIQVWCCHRLFTLTGRVAMCCPLYSQSCHVLPSLFTELPRAALFYSQSCHVLPSLFTELPRAALSYSHGKACAALAGSHCYEHLKDWTDSIHLHSFQWSPFLQRSTIFSAMYWYS